MTHVTEEEILDAIRASLPPDAEGFTSVEVGKALGITQGHAREYIRRLSRIGKLAFAGHRH